MFPWDLGFTMTLVLSRRTLTLSLSLILCKSGMTLNKPSPIGQRCVCRYTCISSVFRLLIWMSGVIKGDSGTKDGLTVQSSRTRPGALEAAFMNLSEIKRQTAAHHSLEQWSRKRKETRITVSKYASSDNIRDIVVLWFSGLTRRRYLGMLQFSGVCMRLFLADDWRFLTYASAIYSLLVSESMENGRLTCCFEKHQPEIQENIKHTSLLTGNLSLRAISLLSVQLCIDKTTLYTTCVYAGINQRSRHWSWFRKWSWIIFIYSNFTRIVHRDMLFAVAPQSRINCVNCAVDFKSSLKKSLFLRRISHKQSKKTISGFFYQWI